MTFKRFILFFSCVSIIGLIGAKADVQGFRLVQQGGTAQINPLDSELHRLVKWSQGGYVFMDGVGGLPPVFYSLDRAGTWTSTAQFKNPEPTLLYVLSWDRFSDGNIVFSGQSETAPRVEEPYLAWTSADGTVQRLVHTGHYFPHSVAVAPDDTIWTLGYEVVNLDFNDPATNKEAHVLRHFDRNGTLLGSSFPQSGFNRNQRTVLMGSVLIASKDRIAWYVPMHMVHGDGSDYRGTYCETTPAMKTINETAGVPTGRSVAFALTDGGNVAVSVEGGPKQTNATYVLDRNAGKWVAVNVPPLGGFKYMPHLIGSDGDNLVFKNGNEVAFFSVAHERV